MEDRCRSDNSCAAIRYEGRYGSSGLGGSVPVNSKCAARLVDSMFFLCCWSVASRDLGVLTTKPTKGLDPNYQFDPNNPIPLSMLAGLRNCRRERLSEEKVSPPLR